MRNEPLLRALAIQRGWIARPQADTVVPLTELLSAEQMAELQLGPDMAERILETHFLRAPSAMEAPQSKIGRYRIVRLLGQGGCGRVYLAHDPEMGREVAVKTLDRSFATPLDRFRREMEILAALKHPNIVAIHDAGAAEDGMPYFAMEYVAGHPLSEAKLPLRETVEALAQVALACQAAHDRGIIHRDLKPANIILGDRPMVVDFGIAKSQGAQLTGTRDVMGTPHYMSPEQTCGSQIGPATDIYSLGVTLYELTTRQVPFDGENPIAIIRQIVEQDPRPPRAIDPSIPIEIEAITLKAMAREPELRYATARAFAEDLRAWLDGRPVSARPSTPLRRLVLAVRRRPLRAAIAAAAAVSLVLGVVLYLRFSRMDARARQAAQVILDESVTIENWKRNLYKPAQDIKYSRLEDAVGRLRKALATSGLPGDLRRSGFAAVAKASSYMGKTEEALAGLSAAIGVGKGKGYSDCLLDRARLRWEAAVSEWLIQDRRPDRAIEEVVADLQGALDKGLGDSWRRELAHCLRLLAGPTVEQERIGVLAKLGELEQAPDQPGEEAAKLAGDLNLITNDVTAAIQAYERALVGRKGYVEARVGLALAELRGERDIQRIGRALDLAFETIRINPRYLPAYMLVVTLCREVVRLNFGRLWQDLDGKVRAMVERDLPLLRENARAHPDNPTLQLAFGVGCVFQGLSLAADRRRADETMREATDTLARAQELGGEVVETRIAQGLAYTVWALQLQRSERKSPASAAQATATILAAATHLRAARVQLEEAERIDPDHADVARWLGYHRFVAKDFDGALAAWNRTIELNPAVAPQLATWIGKANKRMGIDADDPDVGQRWVGFVAYVDGNFAGAIVAWERAIRLSLELEPQLRPWIDKAKADKAKPTGTKGDAGNGGR